MKKKILIIEDDWDAVEMMAKYALEAGHEVLAIMTVDGRLGKSVTRILDSEVIIKAVQNFEPDLTFLDHYLRLGKHCNGDYFARKFGFPKDSLIGISNGFNQDYCGQKFTEKEYLSESRVKGVFLDFMK